jgi:hypothetical protein
MFAALMALAGCAHRALPEMVGAGRVRGMITGRTCPVVLTARPSGYLEPLTNGRPDATSRITRVPSGRARVTRAVRGTPTAGQGASPPEGLSHEPATTVTLLS